MNEQPLDLRSSLAALRRRWKMVVAIALVGLVAGGSLGVLRRPNPTAVALVLLPPSTTTSAGTPTRDSHTQIIIATSTPVLTGAGKSVDPAISAARLKKGVHVTAPSDDILRVQVQAGSPAAAVRLANGVANGYIQYTEHQIAGGGKATVLQPAALVASASRVRRAGEYGLIGLLAGVLLGSIVVLVRTRRDRRLRSRAEIAGAIGVRVLGSLEAEPCKSAAQWTKLFESFAPSPVSAWGLRRVLRELVPADLQGTLNVRVVSFAGDGPALAAGPQLAVFAAQLNLPTLLVPGDSETLEPLRAALAARRASEPAPAETRLVMSVVVVERSQPELTSFVGPTLLSVSAGFAIADDLARVALAASKEGLGIDGLLVVNPDPGDATAGSIGDNAADTGNRRDPGRGPEWRALHVR